MLNLERSWRRKKVTYRNRAFEAQSITIALEKKSNHLALTRDLFKNFAERFDIVVKQVVTN
jgi:hypothetical protein